MSRVRLRRYSRSGRKCKLASNNNGLARFDTAVDHSEIAVLTLAWLHRTKVDSIVRFHYEHERPALANLDGLRRHAQWNGQAPPPAEAMANA